MPATDSQAMNNFRANVLRIIHTRELTISQIARDTDMSRPSLSNVLRGLEDCTIPRAERIAAAIQVDLTDLLKPAGKQSRQSA